MDILQKNRLLLIYNPVAGEGAFKENLDTVVHQLQKNGYQVVVHRTSQNDEIDIILHNYKNCIDTIVAAGGDGTIHKVVNGIFKAGITDIPLGIIPVGTSNDIANYLGIPTNFIGAIDVIGKRKVERIDIGETNGIYFVNVASGGLMTEVPHTTNVKLKNLTGRLAYYLKGIEKLPNLKPIPVRINCAEQKVEADILLFIILNGSIAGGFKKLAPAASMVDGKFDVLIFKSVSISKLLSVFVKILRGEHVGDSSLIYFQSAGPIEILCESAIATDIDGEKGPLFPMNIKIHPRILPVFVN
ncbi:MAG: hypothetical protein APF76_10390 [Desulfitibacter sp. BRH_c19]|nr:MAG: hypothetical protein APF76_10390 [Desulfitibacter sp. BRH_c19]